MLALPEGLELERGTPAQPPAVQQGSEVSGNPQEASLPSHLGLYEVCEDHEEGLHDRAGLHTVHFAQHGAQQQLQVLAQDRPGLEGGGR